ncbi:uncharacterized protein F4812DRAFT_113077 [Daldinia caldariorum]|uniref:uncharacterized protein n=1 Tax=Daldinia caldariorum TaxID=326644 RepID=UPI002008A0F4|nr:uncharacterized protein F4812DRAFT_113077 [Daldinia caldariorum]KAI1465809.1 hypothetical protein F4812DRAFT_113077 [Daldinia caldariorum]
MSFGFSVGDILAGAQLAYTLCKSLSEIQGASNDYQELIAQLNVVHKVLVHVDELRAANQLPPATVNALLFTINTTNEAIDTFLTQYETYEESLRRGGSGNMVIDVYKKGKWATQMPDKVRDLKGTLSTMLAATNCLVSLACYYNTSYHDKYASDIYTNCEESQEYYGDARPIKLAGRIYGNNFDYPVSCPGFDEHRPQFFRPGQIFAAQITSNWLLEPKEREFEKVDFGNLPLEPTSLLEEKAAAERLENRARRLDQIRNLPLEKMVRYCEDVPGDSTQVKCLLCERELMDQNTKKEPPTFAKDLWASSHFRYDHWKNYFPMLPPDASLSLRWDRKKELEPSSDLAPHILSSDFSAETWIDLTHVTDDRPIYTDNEIIGRINKSTRHKVHPLMGPILIRRFVVVRQGLDDCLCLGIHTYSRRGCGDQPDQELFGILHSSNKPPPPMPNETKMVLSPVRMKSDHPSTALSRTARIHYGRAYRISHKLWVQSIGLIKDASMEVLLDQFEANVYRKTDDTTRLIPTDALEPQAEAADINIAQAIRENVVSVLGPDIAPEMYQPLNTGDARLKKTSHASIMGRLLKKKW